MINHIYHDKCPEKLEGYAPEYKWGGFSMGNVSDYICEACGDQLWIDETPDNNVGEENLANDLPCKNRNS
jgi:hypothetical protein